MVRIPTGDTNPDQKGFPSPGRYLFTVNDVEPTEDSLKCEFSVVAGKPNDPNEGPQAGRTLNEFLKLFGKAASRLLQWACATKLITKDEWRAARDKQAEVDFDEMQAIGRFFCGEVQLKPYAGNNEEHKGKSFPALDFRIWPIDDPQVRDIIEQPDVWAHVKGLLPADYLKATQAKAPQQPAQQKPAPQKQPAAAAAGDDPFDAFG